jgi:hypothetical protein
MPRAGQRASLAAEVHKMGPGKMSFLTVQLDAQPQVPGQVTTVTQTAVCRTWASDLCPSPLLLGDGAEHTYTQALRCWCWGPSVHHTGFSDWTPSS